MTRRRTASKARAVDSSIDAGGANPADFSASVATMDFFRAMSDHAIVTAASVGILAACGRSPMTPSLDDTIASLSSPPGPAVRGIVRASGPDVVSIVSRVFQAEPGDAWKQARRAAAFSGIVRIERCVASIPATLHLWPSRRSYTGQPVAELHLPGSPPLLEAVLEALCACGARLARPGEFTLRAFLAGKLDLTQAEAVLGVIDAHDERELQEALSQLAGGLSQRMTRLRGELLDLLADIEAGLDFVDEDIEFVTPETLDRRLNEAASFVRELAAQAEGRMTSRVRRRVVLAGLPNAGKSTLFNRLLGRDAAIVSETAGTTRDWLVADWECRGMPVELVDTAGWDPGRNGIESLAQSLRDDQWERADLIVWCIAADFDPATSARDETLRRAARSRGRPLLIVGTKCDAAPVGLTDAACLVSATTGQGMDRLVAAVADRLGASRPGERQFLGTTAARCRESLLGAYEALGRSRAAAKERLGDEIVALELREALDLLGRVTGAVFTDDVLDRLFSRFCIGK